MLVSFVQDGTEETDVEQTLVSTRRRAKGGVVGRRFVARTPQSIDRTFLKSVVMDQYYVELAGYRKFANYELGLRAAFQNMLATVAKHIGWSLVPEMTLGKIRPDGVVLSKP